MRDISWAELNNLVEEDRAGKKEGEKMNGGITETRVENGEGEKNRLHQRMDGRLNAIPWLRIRKGSCQGVGRSPATLIPEGF